MTEHRKIVTVLAVVFALLVFGSAIFISIGEQQQWEREREILQLCHTTCNGHVERFELDWRRNPVCVCVE